MRTMTRGSLFFTVFLFTGEVVLSPPNVANASAAKASPCVLAKSIRDTTGFRDGLVVHLGCGDGRLTAALADGGHALVHGLDTDTAHVIAARKHIQSLGLYGPVSVDSWDGQRLPYIDNLVNLLVAEDLGQVGVEEAMRVLAPGGVLLTRSSGQWAKTVKPRPGDTDEWTHYQYDASGNAVSHDERVGPPGRLQWSCGPRYTRSHEHIPSIYSVVSTGGRVFYIADAAPVESIRRTPQWQLVARDAYNGLLLWKRPVGEWFPHIVNWGQTPNQLQRKLVAVGDRVYVAAGLHAPLSVLDAASGKKLRDYDGTAGTEEIVLHGDTLLLVVRRVTDARIEELHKWARLVKQDGSPVYERESAAPLVARLRTTENQAQQSLVAIDADSGRLRWKKDRAEIGTPRPLSLRAGGDRVFYQKGSEVVCLDLATGELRWAVGAPPLRTLHGDRLICASDDKVAALSVADGSRLWTQPATLIHIRDAFVTNGALWLGGFKPWQGRSSGKRGPAWGPYYASKYDLATGEKLVDIEPENPGHHHRCYANKATDRYILGGRRGTEFIDLATGEVLWNSWARGVCRYGVMPANGLLYTPPHACGCYITAKLTGFNAMAARRPRSEGVGVGDEPLSLQRGTALAEAPTPQPPIPNPSLDWPTYRGNAERSGATPALVPSELREQWRAELGGRLSSLAVAGGKVFAASVNRHQVVALDADSGKPAWQFTAGARVDSPPTIDRGRCLFGCRDGYVYGLRASDGALAWRLRAAGSRHFVVVDGQLESAGPVHGSVLVRDGVATFIAGRSTYLDGGLEMIRVESLRGKVLSRTPVYSPDPETGHQPPQSGPSSMPGTRSDILACDRDHVYLRDMVFDHAGKRQSESVSHLFTLTDFLDDRWPHRSYWIFGRRPSIATGCSGRDKSLVYGRLIVFDEATIYGFGRATVHWSNHLQDGPYRLFAVGRQGGSKKWDAGLPIRARALVLAGDVLFAAGLPAEVVERPEGPGEQQVGQLLVVSAVDGRQLASYPLDSEPVFDGMAAAQGKLYLAMADGSVVCFGKETSAE